MAEIIDLRRAAWRRDHPAQAAEHDEARGDYNDVVTQLRAEGAPADEIADVWRGLDETLRDIDRHYTASDDYDDGPHVRGLWEL